MSIEKTISINNLYDKFNNVYYQDRITSQKLLLAKLKNKIEKLESKKGNIWYSDIENIFNEEFVKLENENID